MKKYITVIKILCLLLIFTGALYAPLASNKVEAGSCLNGCCSNCSQCTNFLFTTPPDTNCVYSCYSVNHCSDGSTTCGSCPSNPPPPPGTPPPNNPPPQTCTAKAPGAPTSLTPVDGAVNVPKPITFTWTNPTNWGNGCPTTKRNRLFYAIKLSTGCPTTSSGYSRTGFFSARTSLQLDTQIEYGNTYCWFVVANNGSISKASAVKEFTTSNLPTQITAGLASADVCGSGSSGNVISTGVSNPIDWSVTYDNPEPANTLDYVVMLMVPTTGTYALNTTTADWNVAYPKALNSGSFAFAINQAVAGNTTGQFQYLQKTPVQWNGATVGSTSLNSDNGNATLMDLGIGTFMTFNGSQTTANFRIRFNNNFPAGTYNVYMMGIVRNPALGTPGYMASSDATATLQYVVRNTGTWKVDTKAPSVTLGGPVHKADGSVSVTWNASDTVGLASVYSYIYSDVNGATLHDNTKGFDIATGTTALSYPDTSNAGVDATSLGTRNYSDLSASSAPSYTYKLVARDAACNMSETSVVNQTPTAWLMSLNGDISGIGGINKLKVPDITNFSIPPYLTGSNSSFLSNFGALSGTATNANGTISKFNENATNYLDDAINSPTSTNGLWYSDLLNKVKANAQSSFTTLAGNQTFSGNLSNGLATGVNTKANAEVTGNLTVNKGSVCNVRSIIFVQGDLTIDPDLTLGSTPASGNPLTQIYDACMFVVKGNVTIGIGNPKTPNIAPTSSTLASYDIVNALILTDGTFTTPVDNLGATRKWDGLYINGGVIARSTFNGNTTLNRDLNTDANNIQPAIIFNYDPRYLITFGTDLASRGYSIREYGL